MTLPTQALLAVVRFVTVRKAPPLMRLIRGLKVDHRATELTRVQQQCAELSRRTVEVYDSAMAAKLRLRCSSLQ